MPASRPIKIEASGHLGPALNALSQVPKEENGRISWESNKLDEGTFELIYSLKFKPSIDDHIKDGALWHVLNECARAKNFSTGFFLQRLRAFVKAYLDKRPNTLVAISQANCTFGAALPKKLPSIFGAVEFRHSLSKSDIAILNKLSAHERDRLGLLDDFVYLTSHVRATDDRSAIDAAYRNIKYCLGVLNLICHGYGVSKRFGFPNAPMGTFLSAASIFTIDRKRRKLGGYLSENHYPVFFKRNFSVRQKQESDVISKYAKHYVANLRWIDFSEKIVQAVILFQEGLEATHIDVALLKLWTGIELLCARETKEATDKVVERASSLFTNPAHAAMRLDFIQQFRNKIVHRGDAGDHSLLCAQWASIYLAAIIGFFLFNKYKMRRHSEILDFLSIPLDAEKLTEAMSVYRRRLSAVRQRGKT